MDIALGKFFLDVLRDIVALFGNVRSREGMRVPAGAFLELYGSVVRLEGLVQRIHASRQDKNAADNVVAFFDEVGAFGEVLRKLNLDAIDVYYPHLGSSLQRVLGEDVQLAAAAEHALGPIAALRPIRLRKIVATYVRNYDPKGVPMWRPGRDLDTAIRRSRRAGQPWWETKTAQRAIVELSEHLPRLRRVLAGAIRGTWRFSDVAGLPGANSSARKRA